MVIVEAYEAPAAAPKRRIGSLEGQYTVPDDFDTMGQAEIERLVDEGAIFPSEPKAKGDRAA